MKFDLHCHTKEGSIDAKVKIEDYIKILISKGFDGMLVTDHNSYKGYDTWQSIKDMVKLDRPFVVLKGIEYDTRDGGHFIVILPDQAKTNLIEVRGMRTKKLLEVVHELGGIAGPAHPYDIGLYAYMNTRVSKRNPQLYKQFDFVEAFNSCAKIYANQKARAFSKSHHIIGIAGSDSHRKDVVGTAYTEFEQDIYCNDDLIAAIKGNSRVRISEDPLVSLKMNIGSTAEKMGIVGYYVYNKTAVIYYAYKRHVLHRLEEEKKLMDKQRMERIEKVEQKIALRRQKREMKFSQKSREKYRKLLMQQEVAQERMNEYRVKMEQNMADYSEANDQ